jgi:hypothetical protein
VRRQIHGDPRRASCGDIIADDSERAGHQMKRDVAAAKAFFRRAFSAQGRLPHKITLDSYQASHRAAKEALGEHPEGNQCEIRSSKYLTDVFDKAFPNRHGGEFLLETRAQRFSS